MGMACHMHMRIRLHMARVRVRVDGSCATVPVQAYSISMRLACTHRTHAREHAREWHCVAALARLSSNLGLLASQARLAKKQTRRHCPRRPINIVSTDKA